MNSKDETVPNSLIVNGRIIKNESSVAEILSYLFDNIGSNLAFKLPKAKTFNSSLPGYSGPHFPAIDLNTERY